MLFFLPKKSFFLSSDFDERTFLYDALMDFKIIVWVLLLTPPACTLSIYKCAYVCVCVSVFVSVCVCCEYMGFFVLWKYGKL